MKIEISKILPSPFQVRSNLNGQLLAELMKSMEEVGQIVPVKARPLNGNYELVYGHRRLESAKLLGWKMIEAIVEKLSDKQVKIQALAENVQRDDLEPIDEARGYFNLWREGEGDMIIEEIADQFGKDFRYIGKFLKLIKQPKSIQEKVVRSGSGPQGMPKGKISIWHIDEAEKTGDSQLTENLLEKAANEGLTVAQTRNVAQSIKAAPAEQRRRILDEPYNPQLWHDPEFIKERAEKHGAHDPIYRKRSPKNDAAWRDAPEVIALIDMIKGWKSELGGIKQAADINKMAPEAMRFIAGRLRRHAADCIYLADWLEEQNDG